MDNKSNNNIDDIKNKENHMEQNIQKSSPILVNGSDLYNNDFYAWANQQASIIQTGKLDSLDTQHILEELQIMSARERKELVSRLKILLLHLLKWKYQPQYQGKSWILSIKSQRYEVAEVIEINPSLKHYLDHAMNKAYPRALLRAAKETKLAEEIFPYVCPWSYEQIMQDSFLPE